LELPFLREKTDNLFNYIVAMGAY